MRRSFHRLAIVAALAVLSAPRVAVGDPTAEERAAAAFDQGVARFRLGDHTAALAAFEEAYRLAPTPAVLYNIGKTRAALGRDAPAYAALERYLSESGPSVPAARRTEVMRLLGQLRPRIASVPLQVRPEGALVAIDGGPADPLPPGGVLYLAPGEHVLVFSAPGHDPRTETVNAEAGGTSSVTVTLTLTPAPPPEPVDPPETHVEEPRAQEPRLPLEPPPPAPRRTTRGIPGGALLFGSIGLVALGTTAVTGILALGADSDVQDARDAVERGEPVDRDELDDTASRGQTLATVADVALGVGVVTLGVAIVWAVTAGDAADSESPGAVTLDGRRLRVAF